MKVYFDPKSPFARKVRVMMREKGRLGDVEFVQVSGTPLDPGSIPVEDNPLGKIPVLKPGTGRAVYDSRVICRYLDEATGGGMYPSPPRLWDALTLEATADGIMDAAVLMVYEWRCRPEGIRSADWTGGQWSKIARALDALDSGWMGHLEGPDDIAHVAVACALGYLDFRHADRDWRSGRKALADWHGRYSTRESMAATVPTG